MNEISKLRLVALELALERAHPDIVIMDVIEEAATFYKFLTDSVKVGDCRPEASRISRSKRT